MPEVGGKAFASEFRASLSGIRQALDELKLETAAAVTELVTEVKAAASIPRLLRAEASEVRSAAAELLGNKPPDEIGPGDAQERSRAVPFSGNGKVENTAIGHIIRP